MIRPAKFVDVLRLTVLAHEMLARSVYAGFTPDEGEFKRICINAVRLHGDKRGGGCLFVAEDGKGVVQGFILGALDRVYAATKEVYATDVFFYVTPSNREPRYAGHLLDAFLEWAKAQPRVVEIKVGATDAISDPERVARLYERKGLTRAGVIYRARVER